MSTYCSIYVTFASVDEARRVGRALVEARLVACVNVLPSIESFYWWDGKVEEDREAALIAKTTADKVDAVVAKVRSLHSYSCPCIVAWSIVGGHPDYLAWVERETAP